MEFIRKNISKICLVLSVASLMLHCYQLFASFDILRFTNLGIKPIMYLLYLAGDITCIVLSIKNKNGNMILVPAILTFIALTASNFYVYLREIGFGSFILFAWVLLAIILFGVFMGTKNITIKYFLIGVVGAYVVYALRNSFALNNSLFIAEEILPLIIIEVCLLSMRKEN